MADGKRSDPRRRSAASRPGGPGRSGDGGRAKPRATSARREPRAIEARAERAADQPAVESDEEVTGTALEPRGRTVRDSIAAAADAAAEQRFGSAARRAAILAAVICVLTLTIAGPVRTYFAQRTEMKQIQASEAQLRQQISELESQKAKLADPVFIAAQARERLGFVMPGEIPYQVQLPPGAATPGAPAEGPSAVRSGDPWYTSLWHTISDEPHGISPSDPAAVPGAPAPGGLVPPGAPVPPVPAPPGG